ncbi:MAG: response regulator [Planctomycetota bacterium]
MGRILAVDDERDVLLLYQEALGTFGHEVIGAISAAEAMEVLGRERPDLIILDLRMPGTSGLDLLEWVRSRDREVPIIVCSALAGLRRDFAIWNSHVAAFLPKPLDMSRLIQEVAQALGDRQDPSA